MTDEEWQELLEEDAKWQELDWAEYCDEQEYYQVCRD